jgi:thiamine-phosphate pyrophosphorylase
VIGDETGTRLRERLASARLYLIADARALDRLLPGALAAGVDVVQLRDKELDDDGLVGAAERVGAACRSGGALAIVNDRPEVALRAGADGVHLGQDDAAPARARAILGPAALIGVSTHDVEQIAAADAAPDVDYFAVGPVHETPTKPGRSAIGLDPVRRAAADASKPFFAIGGIDAASCRSVLAAGAERLAVVRAIVEADDPAAAARSLRAAIEEAVRDGAVA